jgi:hypothetical protein
MIDAKKMQEWMDEGQRLMQEATDGPDECNADGDTLEDMKAVQKLLGYRAIQADYNHQGFVPKSGEFWHMDATRYRITAKHADRFDAECMDEETFCRAVIEQGDVVKVKNTIDVCYYDTIDDDYMFSRCGAYRNTIGTWSRGISFISMSRITRAQYEQETGPKPERITHVRAITTTGECWVAVDDFREMIK